MEKAITTNKMECEICGYIYDESKGSLRDGISPGTTFDDIPEDWVCPDCQVGKEYFCETD